MRSPDAMVWDLAAVQEMDGSRRCDVRPPFEDGMVRTIALALRALQLYPIRGLEGDAWATAQALTALRQDNDPC